MGNAEPATNVRLRSLYLFVADLEASLVFYRLLGLNVEAVSEMFARVGSDHDDGMILELGTGELTSSYDPNWRPAGHPASSTLGFELCSSHAVDETYEQLVNAGYRGHLEPFDAPWGARFAIVLDPDQNYVGLHGPRDRQLERQRERR